MRQPGPSAESGKADQRSALVALFRAEFRGIYRFVLSRSGSREVAEDVTAETFAEAARVLSTDSGHAVTTPWLYTVARRRLIDHWRKVDRHRRRIDRLRFERLIEVEDPNHEEIEDQRVLDALSLVPPRQRAALTMRHLDEYSVTEIADTLQVTYKAAESLLSRARAAFATAMEIDDE